MRNRHYVRIKVRPVRTKVRLKEKESRMDSKKLKPRPIRTQKKPLAAGSRVRIHSSGILNGILNEIISVNLEIFNSRAIMIL